LEFGAWDLGFSIASRACSKIVCLFIREIHNMEWK
jgi:hypothetical protein